MKTMQLPICDSDIIWFLDNIERNIDIKRNIKIICIICNTFIIKIIFITYYLLLRSTVISVPRGWNSRKQTTY